MIKLFESAAFPALPCAADAAPMPPAPPKRCGFGRWVSRAGRFASAVGLAARALCAPAPPVVASPRPASPFGAARARCRARVLRPCPALPCAAARASLRFVVRGGGRVAPLPCGRLSPASVCGRPLRGWAGEAARSRRLLPARSRGLRPALSPRAPRSAPRSSHVLGL